MVNDIIKKKLIKYIEYDQNSIITLKTKDIKDINLSNNQTDCLINLEIINNIRWINKFHEHINLILKNNGLYISCAETLLEREKRKKSKVPYGFKNIYFIIDFIYKRVIPKLPFFKQIYFEITKGHNRVISKSEILGRLISCGFEIMEIFETENLLFIISKKIKSPIYDMSPSYGPIFKMKRIGYKGKIIFIYKFRTMYPYSEYLQKHLYEKKLLGKDGDKIENDYRITFWGKIIRKFWIDEIPQILNWIKGDVTLVGVRALSEAKFNLYNEKLQKLRIRVKPGLIPPFYADLPNNFEELQSSENRYLIKKSEQPFLTDFTYFFKAIYNIVFKGARSQ